MSILGVIARTRPGDAEGVRRWLKEYPGVEVALDPGDGRLVLVIEDTDRCPAQVAMAQIALNPQVVNLSLVSEYPGESAPSRQARAGFAAWRSSLEDLILPAQTFEPALGWGASGRS